MGETLVRWDRRRIAIELSRRHRRGLDICSTGLRRTDTALHSAAVYWFGSYARAVKAAGLDYAAICHSHPNRWSKAEIIRQLRARKGKPLNQAAMEREMPALVMATYRYFGNYRKALRAAGFDYAAVRVRPRRIWNSRRVVGELKKVRKAKAGLWQNEIKRTRPDLLHAAQRYFGSYPRAAKAAGIDTAAVHSPTFRFWSPPNVIAELQRMHRRRERLNPTHLREHRSGLMRASTVQFGSYRKAVAAAGIAYESIARTIARRMPPAEVVARLKALFEGGKDIRYVAMERNEPRLLDAARGRFGSYRSAVEAAGIAYPPLKPIKHWTEPLILHTLHDLNRLGVDLRYSYMKRRYLPLYEAARYFFGFYTNAVREAGIDYDRVVQRQLKLRRSRAKRQ